MIERHPDRPETAAILQAARAANEDARGRQLGITQLKRSPDGFALSFEVGGEGFTVPGPSPDGEEEACDEKFNFGQTGTGRRQLRFDSCIHTVSLPYHL